MLVAWEGGQRPSPHTGGRGSLPDALLPISVLLDAGVAVATAGTQEAEAAALHISEQALGLADIGINLCQSLIRAHSGCSLQNLKKARCLNSGRRGVRRGGPGR